MQQVEISHEMRERLVVAQRAADETSPSRAQIVLLEVEPRDARVVLQEGEAELTHCGWRSCEDSIGVHQRL